MSINSIFIRCFVLLLIVYCEKCFFVLLFLEQDFKSEAINAINLMFLTNLESG